MLHGVCGGGRGGGGGGGGDECVGGNYYSKFTQTVVPYFLGLCTTYSLCTQGCASLVPARLLD